MTTPTSPLPTGGSPAAPHTGSHSTAHSNRIGWGWWVVAAAGGVVTLAIVAVALVGAIRSGKEIDPTQMIAALLTFLTGLSALLVPKLNAMGKNTSQTAEHVVNSHGARILRDDIDEIKRLAVAAVQGVNLVQATQAAQAADIIGIRQEIGQIRKAERDQWDAIEDTAGRIRGRYPKEN